MAYMIYDERQGTEQI